MNEQLEKMIDCSSVEQVLDAIGLICSEKADHIEENWQDLALSNTWNRMAGAVVNAHHHAKDLGL